MSDDFLEYERMLENYYLEISRFGGIKVIKSVTQGQIHILREVVGMYEDLDYFIVPDEDSNNFVIRYRKYDDKVDYQKLMDSANNIYSQKHYSKSLSRYLLLLSVADSPNDYIYSKIGLCYYKLGEFEKAEDYFMVANYKNKITNKKNDVYKTAELFERRLNKLDYERNKLSTKPVETINSEKIDYENFDEFVSFVKENNSDIESAGNEFDLTNEQRDMIKLIFAREYYKQGDIDKGNYYLNAVEQSPNKSKKIVKFLEEVRRNKQFYQYRDDNKVRKLVFIKTGKRPRINVD